MPLAPAAPDKTAEAGIYGFSLSSSSHQPRTGRRDHSTKSCMIGKQIKVSRLMRGEREEAWLENRCVCLCVGGERERERKRKRSRITLHVTSFVFHPPSTPSHCLWHITASFPFDGTTMRLRREPWTTVSEIKLVLFLPTCVQRD